MATKKKQDILQEVLTEYGYSGWHVIQPSRLNPAMCFVFNPKEKKMGEVSIPDEWLDDPRRRSAIGESLKWTIQNYSYVLPQAHLTSADSGHRLPRPARGGGGMSRATPHMRNFAKRLIADKPSGNKAAATKNTADFNACEKLRPNLTTLMGNVGFCALLSRALALAQAEVLWLRAVKVNTEGTLEVVEESAHFDPDKLFEGELVLLAQLLGLLVAFIGKSLTLRLVREVWPNAKLDELDFGTEGKNEKRK